MKNISLKSLRSFIGRNVNPPEIGTATRFWPREMKIAKELHVEFPDDKFWENFNIDFGKTPDGKLKKINSLAYFKLKSGNDLLKRKYAEFHYIPVSSAPPPQQLCVSDRKFGETLYNSRPPRFLSDFLK